jgi:mannose-6-phosphate isomerase-like protein (cupin superfamily)
MPGKIYIITAGVMTLEDRTAEVKADDSVVILPFEWHTIENLDPVKEL